MFKWICFVALISGFFFASPALAYKVKCNDTQTMCEVDTKRLIPGDRVGIFDEDGMIVAIGTVVKLKGRMRVVKLDKKYSSIMRSHELELIRDEEAQNPSQFFKFHKGNASRSGGVQAGFTSMGVGEGFNALDGEGYMQFRFRETSYAVGRFMFLNGSGKTTYNDLALNTQDISVTLFGFLGGMSWTLMPHQPVALRGEAAIGFGQMNASVSGGGDAQLFTDGRVKSGLASLIRLEAAAIFNVSGYKPFLAAAFARIQNSNNTGVFGGMAFDF